MNSCCMYTSYSCCQLHNIQVQASRVQTNLVLLQVASMQAASHMPTASACKYGGAFMSQEQQQLLLQQQQHRVPLQDTQNACATLDSNPCAKPAMQWENMVAQQGMMWSSRPAQQAQHLPEMKRGPSELWEATEAAAAARARGQSAQGVLLHF